MDVPPKPLQSPHQIQQQSIIKSSILLIYSVRPLTVPVLLTPLFHCSRKEILLKALLPYLSPDEEDSPLLFIKLLSFSSFTACLIEIE